MRRISSELLQKISGIKVNYPLVFIIALLIGFRLFHLSGDISNPHQWRQFDTKQYIDGYYYDQAPFLEPTVCWMGGHKTLILEFPLPEYIVAQLYKVFGPHLIVARLFFLLFFALAMVYLYKALRLLFSNWIPELTVLIAGMMPLSLVYSRAVHIDFFVLAFSLAMVYFTMKAIRNQHMPSLLIGVGCGIIALVVKAPYAFYFAIPILLFAFQEKKAKWFLKRAPLFGIPVLLLYLWVNYTKSTNALAPDWSIIPGYNKFTDMSYWYFGTWRSRFYSETWTLIGERIYFEVLGIVGSVFMLIGLIFYKKSKEYYWALILLLSTILYVFVFFNLNVKHNYYQIPFVICCGLFIAMGIQWVIDRLSGSVQSKYALLVAIPGLFLFESVNYAEANYYDENYYITKISKEIRKFTDEDDLIIVMYGGLTPQCPLILQPSGRYGWSVRIHDFSPRIPIELWEDSGATKLVFVYGGYPEGQLQKLYEAMDNKKSVLLDNQGQVLYMCDLDFTWPKPEKKK